MTKGTMTDPSNVIGLYPLSKGGAVLVHAIDSGENKILASINGDNPQWYSMTMGHREGTEELDPGFFVGPFFVPFREIVRLGEKK